MAVWKWNDNIIQAGTTLNDQNTQKGIKTYEEYHISDYIIKEHK